MRYLPFNLVGTKGLAVSLRDENGKVLYPIGYGITEERMEGLKARYKGLYVSSDDKAFSPYGGKRQREEMIKMLKYISGNGLLEMTASELDALANDIENYVNSLIKGIKETKEMPLNTVFLDSLENYLVSHQVDTAIACVQIGSKLGLSEKELVTLAVGGMFCDIGKAFLPKPLFVKKNLTDEEWEMMKTHPAYGSTLIKNYTHLSDKVSEIILHHHERLDGSGYPDKIKDVTLLAGIAGASDTYTAMLYEKDYRLAHTPEAIIDFFKDASGKLFAEDICKVIIEMTDKYSLGSFVRLVSGKYARLMEKTENGYIALIYADSEEAFTYSYEEEIKESDIAESLINIKKG